MKEINIFFDVDDVAPVKELGLEKDKGNLKYLIALNKEFGCKFTLFVVPNWHDNNKLTDNISWCKWLRTYDCFEVQNHGYVHLDKRGGPTEFVDVNEPGMNSLFTLSQQEFTNAGFNKPKIIKAPGWLISRAFLSIAPKFFEGIAAMKKGNKIEQFKDNLKIFPITYSINELPPITNNQTILIHSHISQMDGNKNGWNEELYKEVRKFLSTIHKDYDKVNYKFWSDEL